MAALQELLFTYGTLRRDQSNPMQNYLDKNAVWIDEALFNGKLYYADEHPAAISSADEEDHILGDLYEFDTGSGLLQELDRYEGYRPGQINKSLYLRKKKNVILKESGKIREAWIYIYNQPVDRAKFITSGNYVQFSRR